MNRIDEKKIRDNIRSKVCNWKVFGIINADGTPFTEIDYDRAYQVQQGRCKLKTCNKHQSELKRALVVDHDHQTGIFRGLLCDGCNRNKVGSLTLEEALEVVAYLKYKI